ncbi:protein regulator of cytokinesis 1-like [Lampris incognitus]|uniref:protein regulator of cytokinesis 1-like n=1 Tax=Lampris incognitus TaxID=2546036 RepID=UPI0024B5D43A|nr:protein regulator of cytokinesis 1-like [Lampris incognitus]
MRKSEIHAAESVASLNRALIKLRDIWEEIGIPEDQRLQRTDVVHQHVKQILSMMVAEEENLKKRLKISIECCQKELRILCNELQMPPFEEEEGSTMLQLEKDRRTQLEVMRKHKKERMEELKDLIVKDRELCSIMCSTPLCIDQEAVPSLEQLKNYRSYLSDLTNEKERRHDEFVWIKKQIISYMDDLERPPETSFEKDVMCENEEAFCLSNDNIAALKLLLSQLEECKAERERCCSVYRAKILVLWDRLQIPQEEKEAFSEHMANSKRKNMEALQDEVQRLNVLKMKKIKIFIGAIRAEISHLWEKCFYSQEQRQAFAPYNDDNFTEELLNLHEVEVSALRKCYEDHKELFDGVRKWQENWLLFIDLEKKANNPSRFNNRGGNLLKEEKQRSELQKSLSKLEKSLKVQTDLWEQECGEEFLVDGLKFLEYVDRQWTIHQTEKEKEKLERQLKKNKPTEEDTRFRTAVRTPSKRRAPGNPTPGKVRKLSSSSAITTPNFTASTDFGGTICLSAKNPVPLQGSGPRIRRFGKTPRELDRDKENLDRNTPGGILKSQDGVDGTLNSAAGSYSEFARELSHAFKSSLTSGQLNSTVNYH